MVLTRWPLGPTQAPMVSLKVYVVEVRRATKGPQVLISRTHPGLVKRLFELEVPEIYDGTVQVMSIAREAGSRTKLAVWSDDENVDPSPTDASAASASASSGAFSSSGGSGALAGRMSIL